MPETGAETSVNGQTQPPINHEDSTPLRTLCAELHAKVEAFVQEDVETETLKNVQTQCRHSLSIISEALERYPTSTKYHLALSRYVSQKGMKAAFAEYLSGAGSSIQAIFVGTRRTDPHGASLTPFDPTDRGWPPFMRVHPVLEWRYKEVWAFLRYMRVEYCVLYERGYTSLGGTNDTHPNPRLKVEGVGGAYRPAWMLEQEGDERAGRES
ncbi:hypothetical protein N7G274_003016 [Stereocaulon virgatum]|uniref:FAD synthase n=1 Tax=Stereocaulon virgatum TaxID=373712 RepID=A0ABR4AHK8_9LECA